MVRRVLSALLALIVTVPLLSGVAEAEIPAPPVITLVNGLEYTWNDPEPAMRAFAIVAASRGWSSADIIAWSPFAEGVMRRESGFCWNVRRGARIDVWEGCVIARQGRGSDAGYAQVLMSVHARWLCGQEWLCSANDVVSSPWNSMTAFVALLERPGGSGNWCYTAKLRRGAVCHLRP